MVEAYKVAKKWIIGAKLNQVKRV